MRRLSAVWSNFGPRFIDAVVGDVLESDEGEAFGLK
jgi:hypothetical protein